MCDASLGWLSDLLPSHCCPSGPLKQGWHDYCMLKLMLFGC